MPKKRPIQDELVRVVGYIRDFNGKPVQNKRITISLPVICTWRDSVILKRQNSSTDSNGRFEFSLPPTSSLSPVTPIGGKLEYAIICEGIGSWKFTVPDDTDEITIGDGSGKKGKGPFK